MSSRKTCRPAPLFSAWPIQLRVASVRGSATRFQSPPFLFLPCSAKKKGSARLPPRTPLVRKSMGQISCVSIRQLHATLHATFGLALACSASLLSTLARLAHERSHNLAAQLRRARYGLDSLHVHGCCSLLWLLTGRDWLGSRPESKRLWPQHWPQFFKRGSYDICARRWGVSIRDTRNRVGRVTSNEIAQSFFERVTCWPVRDNEHAPATD